MKDVSSAPKGKLAVVLRLANGKVETSARWEGCGPAEISLAIAYLEMHKKKLVDALEDMSSGTRVQEEL